MKRPAEHGTHCKNQPGDPLNLVPGLFTIQALPGQSYDTKSSHSVLLQNFLEVIWHCRNTLVTVMSLVQALAGDSLLFHLPDHHHPPPSLASFNSHQP